MSNITFYSEQSNKQYKVNFDLKFTYHVDGVGVNEYYLDIYTSIPKKDGSSFDHYVVRTLDDYPPGGSTATDWTDMITQYINYFVEISEQIASSSSSSSSTSSSSSSSSEGNSSSSSSSSSSSTSSSSSS